jgi:hypothetical protein
VSRRAGDDDSPLDELRAAAADFRGALARLDAELADLDDAAERERERDRDRDAPRGPGPGPPRRPLGTAVDDNCRAMLEVLRKRCPGLVPADDVEPGGVVQPVPIPVKTFSALLVTSLRQAVATAATGRVPRSDAELPSTVLWQEGADALLVEVARCEIALGDGEVTVTIPVRCDQLPDQVGRVVVRLVVGTAARPTGLFAATTTHPQGPPVVVQRWGEALTALAWQALLDVAGGVAKHAGRDADSVGLVPVALVTSKAGFVVLPQARHAIDRVIRV